MYIFTVYTDDNIIITIIGKLVLFFINNHNIIIMLFYVLSYENAWVSEFVRVLATGRKMDRSV